MSKQAIDAPPLKAVGPYNLAVESAGTLYVSGQIPLDPATGKLVSGDVKAQAEQVFANVKAVLAAADLTLDHVVKATVFLTDMNDFAAMNEVYQKHMPAPYPARSTIAVAALPLSAQVEIEVVAVRPGDDWPTSIA
ncbi:MAG: RidA family protein [Hyphomicrobiaceae bacterium]